MAGYAKVTTVVTYDDTRNDQSDLSPKTTVVVASPLYVEYVASPETVD
jgi:hypothetical protein